MPPASPHQITSKTCADEHNLCWLRRNSSEPLMFDGAITNRSGQRCFPKCALMVTIQKIRRRKRIASTEQPQFIVEVLAPTFGDTGDGVKKIGAVLSWGSRAAPILLPSRSQQYEFFVTISLILCDKSAQPGRFLHRKRSSKTRDLNALIQLCENTIGTSHVLSELFCFLQRFKATWVTYASREVVLVVDAEVSTLLLDTYMPGVVFFEHGGSPPLDM